MIYTSLTKKAMKILFDAHQNQFDQSGIPYCFHPWHVAESMDDEESTILALLHDVVEDSNYTFDDLKKEGFSDNIIKNLKLLTRDKDIDYFDYIKNIANSKLAIKVKLSDLKHNMDNTRCDSIDENVLKRNEKYKKSYDYLIKIYNEKMN